MIKNLFSRSGQEWTGIVLEKDDAAPGGKSLLAFTSDDRRLPSIGFADTTRKDLRCCAVLPSQLCIVREMNPPDLRRPRLERVLDGILDTELPFPVEQCMTLHSRVTPSKSDRIHVLSAAARKIDIQAQLDDLATHHVDPAWLLPEPLVYWNDSLRITPPATHTEFRLIAVAREDRQTVLCGRGSRLLTCATGRAGDTTLAQRMLKPFRADSETQPVAFLSGMSEEDSHILARSCFPQVSPEDIHRIPDSAKWLAGALARAGRDGFARQWNFRIHEFMHSSGQTILRRSPIRSAARITFAALFLGGTAVFMQVRAAKKAQAAWRAFDRQSSALAGYRITRRDEQVVDSIRASLYDRMLPAIRRFAGPSPATGLSHLLAGAQSNDIGIHRVSFFEQEWTVHASAPRPEKASDWMAYLENNGWNVRLRNNTLTPESKRFILILTP